MDMYKPAVGLAALIAVFVGAVILFDGKEKEAAVLIPALSNPSTSREISRVNQEGVLYNKASGEQIQVSLPFPGGTVGSDFVVRGSAVDSWFQEDGFAVGLLDGKGNVLYETAARSTDVPASGYTSFIAEVYVPMTFAGAAVLILAEGRDGDLETGAYAVVPLTIDP